MMKKNKLNKLKISIVIVLIVLSLTLTVFGRYIYNVVREAYFVTQQFYFTSDILTVSGANYQYNNWGGTEVYPIQFQLQSYENQFQKLDYDLDYTVTCSTTDSDKIKCSINSHGASAPTTVTGTIPATTNLDIVTIYVTPLTTIAIGGTVKIQVTASTLLPYEKTISCEFTLKRETPEGISYTIEDSENSEYAILKVVNTNDSITPITLKFDPTKLRIDSNDKVYIDRDDSATETSTIDGKQYIKTIATEIPQETARYVKFYKVNKAENYTYPGVQATSPINIIL